MGTALTGTTPQDTYDSLIKVTDNGPLSGTAKYLSDGLGNDSVLALSTSKVLIGNTGVSAINETLNVTGAGIAVEQTDGGVTTMLGAFGSADTILGAFTNNDVVLRTNNVEKMRILAGGNVGIGTSAPAVSLQVGQDAAVNSLTGKSIIYGAAQDVTGTPVEVLTLARPYQSAVSFLGAASLCISKDTANENSRAAKLSIKLSDAADETDFVAASFTKNGLTFNGDTSANNALSDYEQGTWTMGISFDGASVGVTTSLNTGTYTKIGRQVTVVGLVRLTSKGSSTGDARVTGLPFTIAAGDSFASAASLRPVNISFANQIIAFGQPSAQTILLQETTEAGVITTITDANFANDSDVLIQLTYFV
jgi:hypothetical protein